MGADEVESQPTGRSGTEMLQQPANRVSEGFLPTEEKSLTNVQGDGERPQSAGISEATMDLVDFAPEWEPPGQLIGEQYQVIEWLGAGKCGVTYRAGDRELRRVVALKRLRSSQEAAREGIQRFLLQAQAIAPLNHRNIVKIHELGQDARGLFVVMEYLSGGDLRQKIERAGPMALEDSLDLIEAVGQGLAYAHEQSKGSFTAISGPPPLCWTETACPN